MEMPGEIEPIRGAGADARVTVDSLLSDPDVQRLLGSPAVLNNKSVWASDIWAGRQMLREGARGARAGMRLNLRQRLETGRYRLLTARVAPGRLAIRYDACVELPDGELVCLVSRAGEQRSFNAVTSFTADCLAGSHCWATACRPTLPRGFVCIGLTRHAAERYRERLRPDLSLCGRRARARQPRQVRAECCPKLPPGSTSSATAGR